MNSKDRKFVFLINPISGNKQKDTLLKYIHEKATALQLNFSAKNTDKDNDYLWLEQKIKKEGITDVVVIGGDGTVNGIAKILQNSSVRLGIIPSGSGNGLAHSAKIPKNYKKAFDIIMAGKAKQTDAFFINDQFACMLSGVGFDAQVAYDFAKQTRRGLITYTKQSILNFFKARPYPFEIIIDEVSFHVEAYFISVANSNQFGNHFTIAPQASLNDGLLDVVIVQNMNKLRLPFALLQQIRGKNKLETFAEDLQQKNIIYLQTPNITIHNKKNAPLHIDGETVATSDVLQYNIQKNWFWLIQP
jgi:YegS/Rv2252/BmrU family lipid kinase